MFLLGVCLLLYVYPYLYPPSSCVIYRAPVFLRRCRGNTGDNDRNTTMEDEDLYDMARFEAEARAMRRTLARMSIYGGAANGLFSSHEEGDDELSSSRQLQHRKEFLDASLLTKVRHVTQRSMYCTFNSFMNCTILRDDKLLDRNMEVLFSNYPSYWLCPCYVWWLI